MQSKKAEKALGDAGWAGKKMRREGKKRSTFKRCTMATNSLPFRIGAGGFRFKDFAQLFQDPLKNIKTSCIAEIGTPRETDMDRPGF